MHKWRFVFLLTACECNHLLKRIRIELRVKVGLEIGLRCNVNFKWCHWSKCEQSFKLHNLETCNSHAVLLSDKVTMMSKKSEAGSKIQGQERLKTCKKATVASWIVVFNAVVCCITSHELKCDWLCFFILIYRAQKRKRFFVFLLPTWMFWSSKRCFSCCRQVVLVTSHFSGTHLCYVAKRGIYLGQGFVLDFLLLLPRLCSAAPTRLSLPSWDHLWCSVCPCLCLRLSLCPCLCPRKSLWTPNASAREDRPNSTSQIMPPCRLERSGKAQASIMLMIYPSNLSIPTKKFGPKPNNFFWPKPKQMNGSQSILNISTNIKKNSAQTSNCFDFGCLFFSFCWFWSETSF